MTVVEARPPEDETIASKAISEVAEATGISAHTLRYYERAGLLRIRRDHAGRRRYSTSDVRRVIFITRLRHTDMPIREIRRYFALVDTGPGNEAERLELLVQHRDAVRAQLSTLQSALDAIEFKVTMYRDAAVP